MFEFMSGGTLQEVLESDDMRKCVTLRRRVLLSLQGANGLWTMHSSCCQICRHRDFKPGNVLLDAA